LSAPVTNTYNGPERARFFVGQTHQNHMNTITDETLETVKECLPVVVDTVSDLVSDKSGTSTVSSSSSTSSSTRPDSSRKSVWEEPVKMKVFGVFSGEGTLRAFLIAAGAMTLCAIVYKRTTSFPKGDTQKQKKKLPQPAPALTTNRDNIGKPIEGFKCLIPHLAYCGENILLWGERSIGKSYLGIQLSIDFVEGGPSSVFPAEQCAVPKHHVIYYAYELDEQMIRDRYGDYLNKFENLQVVYANPLQGQTSLLLQHLKQQLEFIPDGTYVAIIFDTFKRMVGPANCYDEKKCGDFLHELEKLQAENKASHNLTISNIIIAHQKPNGDGLEGPGCLDQFVKTEVKYSKGENEGVRLMEHRKSNNRRTLEGKIHLHAENDPFLKFVADDETPEDNIPVKNPFKENGDYDWLKLKPHLQRLVNDGATQTEIAEAITDTYGKATKQQSVSAALERLKIEPRTKGN